MLNESDLQKLLDETLKHVSLPRDCAIALEGSLAEGFGNETSDIDFIAIDEGGAEHKTMPILLFVDGRRIEVRLRSEGQVLRQFATLRRAGRRARRSARHLSEELLDRCQRLKHAMPLRGAARIRRMQEHLPQSDLCRFVSEWFSVRAGEAARCASLMWGLGRTQEACSWGRVAVNQSAKMWAAARDETYLSPKWLTQQLGRITGGEDMLDRFLSLDSPVTVGTDPEGYVQQCLTYAEDAGLTDVRLNPSRVTLSAARGVTTWQVGSRVHVVRDREQIFLLNAPATRVWRSLSFGMSLADLLDRLPASERAFLVDLHGLGLIQFDWRGAGRVRARRVTGASPLQSLPVVSIEGGMLPSDDGSQCRAYLLPMAPQKFTSAGLALMWSNMMLENAIEDAHGALTSRQWGTFENSVRRILREACLGILSAFGVTPLPHTEEACSSLAALQNVPQDLRDAATALSFAFRIRSEQEANACLKTLAVFVRQARELAGSQNFPSCFESAEEWRRVLELGYDWTRAGAFLGSDFPYDEVRDLLASAAVRRNVVPQRIESPQLPAAAATG